VFQRLRKIIIALRCVQNSVPTNELVVAWLRTMAGEESFKDILAPILSVKTAIPGLSPLHKAVGQALAGNKYHITPQQLAVMCANPDNYLCYIALSLDSGVWSQEDLIKKLKLKKPAAAKALKELTAVKVLREIRPGFFSCPFARSMIEMPQLDILDETLRKKYLKCREAIINSGKRVCTRTGIIRADEPAFRNFYPLMSLNMSSAATYSITERTEKSAIFAVTGNVIKIRDF
ncbi:MAG: hypothetical protein WCK76_05595, partial [Elusimicrobiota bacterium]